MNLSLTATFEALDSVFSRRPAVEVDERTRRRRFAAQGVINPDVIRRRLARDRAVEQELLAHRPASRGPPSREKTWTEEIDPQWSMIRTQPLEVGK